MTHALDTCPLGLARPQMGQLRYPLLATVVGLHHRWGSTVRAGRAEYYNQGRRIERVVEGLTAEGVL